MIRRARQTDFSRVCEIYAIARAFMAKTGNATQWGDSFPPEELLREDIRLGRLYVVEEAGNVHGAFAFLLGEDPTYQVIEGGAWKSAAPYGTLHRVAGSGEVRGLFGQMVDYAWGVIPHLRIDTHENNAVMRHLVEKHGFQRCGIIYTDDGTPRIAFERGPGCGPEIIWTNAPGCDRIPPDESPHLVQARRSCRTFVFVRGASLGSAVL